MVTPDFIQYPCQIPHLVLELYDLALYQRILNTPANFDHQTDIDVYETYHGMKEWSRNLNDQAVGQFLEVMTCLSRSEVGLTSLLCQKCADIPITDQPRLVLFFVRLRDVETATYRFQVSMSKRVTEMLLSTVRVNPTFLPDLMGAADYYSPGEYVHNDGTESGYEFFCQHPRWLIKGGEKAPCSVYMKHDTLKSLTTYIIVSSRKDSSIGILENHLNLRERTPIDDPFLIHALIAKIMFEHSIDVQMMLKKRLYSQSVGSFSDSDANLFIKIQLSRVDEYTQKLESSRSGLETMTKELHLVSQIADAAVAGTDMAIEVSRRLIAFHERQFPCYVPLKSQLITLMAYTLSSMECQKRLLLSYKARKVTAMNLVFNLVTQQDSSANVDISREMKRDSSSMNTIAALTMIFLPGTFVSAVFGTGMFTVEPKSQTIQISRLLIPWVTITIPLTFVVCMCWYKWQSLKDIARDLSCKRRSRLKCPDSFERVEKGEVFVRAPYEPAHAAPG